MDGLLAAAFPGLLINDTAASGIISSVVVALTLLAMVKKIRMRQMQAMHANEWKQPRAGKEQEMPYIPVNTLNYSGLNTASSNVAVHVHPVSMLWFTICLLLSVGSLITGIVLSESGSTAAVIAGVALFFILLILGITFLTCLKVADQWDRVIILRLGKFQRVQGPGMFVLLPFLDTVAKWIDTRVQTGDLTAEETLTKDTVPVDVDAVMFWFVYDAQKAALEVENFQAAVTWAAQTALRDLIGKTMLAELLVGRDVLDNKLQEIIDERTEPWGVTVQSVEIREIKIPGPLQDAMSRQAQAERERQARVILGESEMQIAQSFAEASKQYENNPTALHLRAMNMLFEGLKEKGSLMIIPSSALDSMNLGAMGGLATLGQHAAEQAKNKPMV